MKARCPVRISDDIIGAARMETSAADVQLLVALVAHMAAKRTRYDLLDADTKTCVEEAALAYLDASRRYLNAALLTHGRHPTRMRTAAPRPWFGLDVPRPDRPRALSKEPSTAALVHYLEDLRSTATTLRASLKATTPHLLDGHANPFLRLEQLRTGRLCLSIADHAERPDAPQPAPSRRRGRTVIGTAKSTSAVDRPATAGRTSDGAEPPSGANRRQEWSDAMFKFRPRSDAARRAADEALRGGDYWTRQAQRHHRAAARLASIPDASRLAMAERAEAARDYGHAQHHYLEAASVYHAGALRPWHEDPAVTIERLPGALREDLRTSLADYQRVSQHGHTIHPETELDLEGLNRVADHVHDLRERLSSFAPDVFGEQSPSVEPTRTTR